MQNRILSSDSSDGGIYQSIISDEYSMDQSHIQQIFNLQNQFLQTSNLTSELQNQSIIKSHSNNSQKQLSNNELDQLTTLNQHVNNLKIKHQEEIENLIQQKDITISQMEQRFQNLLLIERQSNMAQDQENNGEKDELRRAIDRCNKVTEDQYLKMEQVKMKLVEKNHEYNVVKENYDKEQKNAIQLKEEVLQLRMEINQSENQNQLLRTEIQTKQHGYVQYEDVINDSLRRTKEKLTKCEQELSTSQIKIGQLQSELSNQENKIQKLQHKEQMSDNQIAQLKQKQQEFIKEVQATQLQIKELNANYLDREQEWREQELQTNDFRLSTNGLHGKVQQLELIIIEHKKENNCLQNDKQDFEQNLKFLRETLFGSMVVDGNDSHDLKQIEMFVSNLKEEKSQMEEIIIDCRQIIIQLEQDKTHLTFEIQQSTQNKDKMVKEHDNEVNELRIYLQQGLQQTQQINQLKLQQKESKYEHEQMVVILEDKIRDNELNLQNVQLQAQILDKDNFSINTKIQQDLKSNFEGRVSRMELDKNGFERDYQQRIRLMEEEQFKMKDQHQRTVEHLQIQYQQRQTQSSNTSVMQWKKSEQDLITKMNEKDLQLDIERQQMRMLQEQLFSYEQLDQRESVRVKDRQHLLERDLLESNKQKAQLICQVNQLQKELDKLITNPEQQTKQDDKLTLLRKDNEKLHHMIDRLTDQLMHAEGIAQSEQRNSITSKSQVEQLLREKEKIALQDQAERFQSNQQSEDKMSKLQLQMKYNQTMTDDLKDEKIRSSKIFNELSNEHEQLYQEYKERESEAFQLNKLYVDLLQQSTDRQTTSARMIQGLQQNLEELREEVRVRDSQILRQKEYARLSENRGQNISPIQFNYQIKEENQTPVFQTPKKEIDSKIITTTTIQNLNNITIQIQIYQQSSIELIKTRLDKLKTKIVAKLAIYQELIKKKLRTQTKQQIQQDLQQFREEVSHVFENIELRQDERDQILNGAIVQLKYSNLTVQDDMNSQIINISKFIDCFNQLVTKPQTKRQV